MKSDKQKIKELKKKVKELEKLAPKTCDKMDFQEFRTWANEILVKRFLKEGLDGVDGALFIILNQAAYNSVWGGAKRNDKRESKGNTRKSFKKS